MNLLPLPRGLNKNISNIEEDDYYKKLKHFIHYETGYQQIQGTKPFTLAHALNSSPVALCSYISEKFYSWTDNDGEITKINIDTKVRETTCELDYRLYWCFFLALLYPSSHDGDKNNPILVPMGYSEFPKEIFSPPISLANQFYKEIIFWKTHNSGGHFAAMERPEELVKDINKFVKT